MTEGSTSFRRADLTTQGRPSLALVLVGVVSLALYVVLLTPNFDDGVNASHIANTAAGRAFESDVFRTPFPFQKPQTVLSAFIWSRSPANFVPLAVLHGALILSSVILFFSLARRTVSFPEAQTATGIFVFFLLTHNWLSPTRPEMVLLTLGLSVVRLCQAFLETHREGALFLAAVMTGLLGVPTHTNASIIMIFFILFLVLKRAEIGRLAIFRVGGVLGLSILLGILIVVLPEPEGTLRFMWKIKNDGERFTFVLGEVERLSFLARFLFYRTLTLTLVGVAVARLVQHSPRELFTEAHRGLGLLFGWGIATFFVFLILPAALWSAYALYHLPWFALLAAMQWKRWRPSGWTRLLPAMVVTVLLILGVVINLTHRSLDLFDLAKYGCLVLPLLLVVALRGMGKQVTLMPVLAIGLAFKLFLMLADSQAFRQAAMLIRQRSVATVVKSALVWVPRGPLLIPMNSFVNKTGVRVQLAVVAEEEQSAFRRWLELNKCSALSSVRLANPQPTRFISPWFRDMTSYELACSDSGRYMGVADAAGSPAVGR
ncbi:MAG: hypothetical protein GW878_00265 [Acidobacteria bacterium]|nr:hypothetical protein [Acidobacteriota bacterium]